MDVLGHSQIALTMNTNTHVLPGLKQDAAKRRSDLMLERQRALPAASLAAGWRKRSSEKFHVEVA